MGAWEYMRTTMTEAVPVRMADSRSFTVPVVLGVSAGALGLAAWAWTRERNLPPGPSGLRLIVYSIWQGGDMSKISAWMKKKYGEVVSVYFGRQLIVILNSHQKTKEVFVKRNLDFARRLKFATADILGLTDELFFVVHEPTVQKENRNFFRRGLQNHALNMAVAEHKIEAVIHQAVEYVRHHSREEIDPQLLTQRTLAAIYTSVFFSSKYDYGEQALDDIVQKGLDIGCLFHLQDAPMLDFLPAWLGRLLYSREMSAMQKRYNGHRDWVQQEIDNHNASLDPNNPRDLTDIYLLNRPDGATSHRKIVDTFLSLVPDTVEATSDTIRFVLLYIIHHPEVQERIHEELDRVVGRGNQPCLKHRKDMPYLQAVILESMRCCDLAPSSGPHCAFQDTTLDGYHIPKDAWVMADFSVIHNDPEIFQNPSKFDPDRFIDPDGKLANTDCVIPFSIGTRSCLGEPLVKSTAFLLIANLLHEFRFSFSNPEAPPSLKKSEKTKFFACPEPYLVTVQPKGQ